MKTLNVDHVRFLEWLLTPAGHREPATQAEFAATLGVDPSALSQWKKQKAFVAEWDRRLAELQVSPERTQRLVDQMYSDAFDSNNRTSDRLKAMELYMKYIGKMTPDAKQDRLQSAEKRIDELSDAELQELVEAEGAALRAEAERRGLRVVS